MIFLAKRFDKSFKDWCIENNQLYLLDLWDYKLNDKEPSEYGVMSAKKCWFKCKNHIHESELCTINNITGDKHYIVSCRKCNSFGQWCINHNLQSLLDHWDYELNDISPFDVPHGSGKKYWFKCLNNNPSHKSELKMISNLTKQEGTRRCLQCDSFGQWCIDNISSDFIEKYWSTKNTKSPLEYSYRTSKKVWIKCDNPFHEDYDISCSNYVIGKRCPKCGFVQRKSKLERKVIELLDFLNIQYYRESECTLKPINPKTGCYMHYDNQIPSLHLIIEVNGEQHYYSNYFTELVAKSRNITTGEVFNEQLFRDKFKKDYAIQHGYDYLEIPYYTNDKNETYKQLILDKINDIQSHMKP